MPTTGVPGSPTSRPDVRDREHRRRRRSGGRPEENGQDVRTGNADKGNTVVTHLGFATPEGLPPTNGYHHVGWSAPGCRVVWTSGQVGLDAEGKAASGWEAQTRRAFQNLSSALNAGGATWNDVVKLTFFVVDTSALDVVRAVRDEFVDRERPPTSSLVQVAGLFRPDLLIEIEAVAAVSA